ncbi:MAG: glycerate kinase [Clostridia bacterium]|nr:glycerate kinase [Clostridia bacterium]
MKAIVIPDKFKGTMDARTAGEAISKGIISVMPFCSVLRLTAADGGDGTADAYIDNAGGEKRFVTVTGPNNKPVHTYYAKLNDGTAVIEMAKASGLAIAEEGSSPLHTTTYGTGELIKAALDDGCRKLIIGIGGSATNDGGVGMAAALGGKFLDIDGNSIELTGGGLARLNTIDLSEIDSRIKECEILVACDVDNPLCGKDGAAETFSRQKGADEDAVKELEKNLLILSWVAKRCHIGDMLCLKGGGAAGGLGAGLSVFLGGKLVEGAPLLLEACSFEKHAADADFIITGEGSLDAQSLHGKLPAAVAERACGKKVAVIGGRVLLTAEEAENAGFFCVEEASPKGLSMDEIKLRCQKDLEAAAARVARRFL